MKKWNNKGFTLIELLIVIAVIMILIVIWVKSFNDEKAKDTARTSNLREVQTYLTDFKAQYGVYPNSAASGRKYPSGCSVSWYASLMGCFVTLQTLTEGTDTYNRLRFDPSDGNRNDFDKEYTYYYGTAKNGNQYKLCALAGKQDITEYKGLDGQDATVWSRYLCVTSENTKLTDVTSLAK